MTIDDRLRNDSDAMQMRQQERDRARRSAKRKIVGISTLAASLLFGGITSIVGCRNPEVPAGHEAYVFQRPLLF